MNKPSEKPSEKPSTELPKERKIQVPAGLVFQLVDALRATDRDSRRDDRVLHDTTRDEVSAAMDAWNRFQDLRMRNGGRA